MSKKEISPDDLMKSIQSAREGDLSVYECPICKKSGTWIYDGETPYILARLTGKAKLDDDELRHGVAAKNSDSVVRADCSNCGFVALFRRGSGPA